MTGKYNISIIIPAYNAEKTIDACLTALTNQSIEKDKYEIIVVDDGSTDDTCNIVKKYGVRLISQANAGPAAARNRGVRAAKGDIVIFIDSDCVADKYFIENLIKPFSNPKIVGVQGRYKRTRQKKIIARFIQIEIEERYKNMQKKQFIDFIGTYAAAYRRDIFLEMGGFDISFPMASGEDTDFSYRLSESCHKMVFEPSAYVEHKHPDSLKAYLKMKFWRGYWRIRCYRKTKAKALKDTYTGQMIKIQMFLILLMTLLILFYPIFGGKTLLGLSGIVVLFLLSMFPFIIFALKRDVCVAAISPFLVFLRAICCLYGMGIGFIREVILKNRSTKKG